MTKRTKDILRQIADELCSMSPGDFERVIEEHKTGDIAVALNELWAPQKQPILLSEQGNDLEYKASYYAEYGAKKTGAYNTISSVDVLYHSNRSSQWRIQGKAA